MTITAAAAMGAVSLTSQAIVYPTPAWTGTRYVGSLLLMTCATSRVSATTYFGKPGTTTVVDGWTRFGEITQPGYPNRSIARFYRVADGTSLDSPPAVNGYSDTAFATLAGITTVACIELRDGVVGTTCIGKWDLTNAYGLGINTVGNATTTFPTSPVNYAQGTSVGTGTSVALNVAAGIPEGYGDGALWVVAQTAGALSALSGTDASFVGAASGTTSGTIYQGLRALAVTAGALPAASFATTATNGIQTISAYAVGFNPPKSATTPATARIAVAATATTPATAQLRLAANYRTATTPATARISAPATTTTTARARLLAGPWANKFLMGSGNNIDQVLGSPYFVLSGDLDGGGDTATTLTGGAKDLYTIAIDGGQAIT